MRRRIDPATLELGVVMGVQTWLPTLQRAVEPLTRYGNFQVTMERADPPVFGNALIILESEVLRLRFVVDRADFFAAIASRARPMEWFDLKSVLKALGHYVGALGPWQHPDGRFRPHDLPAEPIQLALRYQRLLEIVSENRFQILGGPVRPIQ